MINRSIRAVFDAIDLLITLASVWTTHAGARVVHNRAHIRMSCSRRRHAGRMSWDHRELPRVLTLDGCLRIGISVARVRTELRRGSWRRLAASVFLTRPEAPTRSDWAHVGLALSRGDGALSGWDALRVHGLGAATPPDPRVLILTRRGRVRDVAGALHIRPSSRPVMVSRVAADHPTLARVPMASTARAISDTAAGYHRLAPVRALVTAAVQRKLCTPDELRSELEDGPRGGSSWFRRAIADVVGGAQSIAEAEAFDLLRARGIGDFEPNAPVHDAAGRVVAIVDALWRRLRAALEVDSREFHFDETAWKATMQRHNRLSRAGYAVAHYPPSAIRTRGGAWADEVAAWLRARAVDLGVPFP